MGAKTRPRGEKRRADRPWEAIARHFFQQQPQHGPPLELFTTVRLQLLTKIEQEQLIIAG